MWLAVISRKKGESTSSTAAILAFRSPAQSLIRRKSAIRDSTPSSGPKAIHA